VNTKVSGPQQEEELIQCRKTALLIYLLSILAYVYFIRLTLHISYGDRCLIKSFRLLLLLYFCRLLSLLRDHYGESITHTHIHTSEV